MSSDGPLIMSMNLVSELGSPERWGSAFTSLGWERYQGIELAPVSH